MASMQIVERTTAEQHHDKRLAQRCTLKSTVSIFERNSKDYLGLLVDCSGTGIMISTYESLAPGTQIQLDLVDIPPNIDSRRTGRCTAEVVWCDQITPSLYGTGCRIMEPDDMMTTMLKNYADGMCTRHH